MTVQEACRKWSYKGNKVSQLEELCRAAMGYRADEQVIIPDDHMPIYLPKRSIKKEPVQYLHIMEAICKGQQLLIPSCGICIEKQL